ncbi:serine/threonine-protein kinase [Crateriforma spongiae]|uniref:serine/threonine-protein kinase n=1 Tax=Crateriforma spongiae TaxID=2724528 RepID=UPI001F42515E|nr:serine/threonine-protein kinase [Crateriforma spongiae]
MNIRQQKLPIQILEQIDDRCAAFEKAWQTGNPPSIESVLSEGVSDQERDVLLAELIVLDADYRRRRGESPEASQYLDRFPDHADDIRDALNEGDRPSSGFVPPPVQRVADMFPNLQVIELLGAGGMGAVYKAKQEGLDRVVALKILPAEFAHDAKFSLRFTREARTLAKLNHPNIVSVFEFGNVQDTFFFLMEFVDGPTLRDVVRAGGLSPKHALEIIPHLCDALQYAHDNGVIHRDIKPENILLTHQGTVKIVDFGLSRLLDSPSQATDLTGTHQVMGTPRYMAPEQFEGTHQVDHRADIYSLGVVFYEMLTGELPMGRFAAPSQKVAIDVRLDEVVLRTLEKEPSQRYQAASEIKSDLKSIADSNDSGLAATLVAGEIPVESMADHPGQRIPVDVDRGGVQQQESATRWLLTRRDLMNQVQSALKPLFRWQAVQIIVGVLLIGLGAFGWSQNIGNPTRVAIGIIVHVYGVVFIAAAIAVMTRMKRIDYSQSVDDVRSSITRVRDLYLRLTPLIGFPWWLMWIPAGVAAGLDQVLHPNVLVPSLTIGLVGMLFSYWLYVRVQRPGSKNAELWKDKFAGNSFRNAAKLLDECRSLGIR